MRKEFLSTDLIIDTKRYYPVHELFELMRENLEDKFGAIIIKKVLTVETISVQGVDGYVNKVTSAKWLNTGRGKIIISQKKIKSGILDFGLDYIPVLGIVLGFLNLEGTRANRAMMKTLGEEIEKLIREGT
jgi:hypothetical protein